MRTSKTIMGLLVAAMLVLPFGTVLAQTEPVDSSIGVGSDWMYYDPYFYWYEPGGFEYDSGALDGTYIDMVLDEATGEIHDYTMRFAFHDMAYPALLYDEKGFYDENGGMYREQYWARYGVTFDNITVFDTMAIESFTSNGHPGIFGERFIFQGDNVLLECYDFEGSGMTYTIIEGNLSFTFDVAQGFEVSKFYDWYEEEWAEWEMVQDPSIDWEVTQEENLDEYEREVVMPGMAEEPWFVDYYWDEVWIKGFNTSTSIYIDNGTATIDGNTVTVELGSNGCISIYSWVEMPYYGQYIDYLYEPGDWGTSPDSGLLDDIFEKGLMAAAAFLVMAENGDVWWSDTETYDDPTFQLEFKNMNNRYIEVEVDSAIPTGRIVSLNLNEAGFDVDDLLVKLDGAKVRGYGTLEELTETVGGPEAGYFVLIGETGNTVFVYVPHFSVHTITFESLAGAGNILVPAVLAVALVAVLAVAVVKINRGQDDY